VVGPFQPPPTPYHRPCTNNLPCMSGVFAGRSRPRQHATGHIFRHARGGCALGGRQAGMLMVVGWQACQCSAARHTTAQRITGPGYSITVLHPSSTVTMCPAHDLASTAYSRCRIVQLPLLSAPGRALCDERAVTAATASGRDSRLMLSRCTAASLRVCAAQHIAGRHSTLHGSTSPAQHSTGQHSTARHCSLQLSAAQEPAKYVRTRKT
jgi:hypothetical protein